MTSNKATLPDELSHIIPSFLPSEKVATRTKAFLLLSSFCQGVRNASAPSPQVERDPATERLVQVFTHIIQPQVMSEEEKELLIGVSLLTALFEVDGPTGAGILAQDGVLESIMDSVDLSPTPQLSLGVARLLSQACGKKACREVILPQHVEWLRFAFNQRTDAELRAAAATALVKWSHGGESDSTLEPSGKTSGDVDMELATALKALITSEQSLHAAISAIEGLAYASTNLRVKDLLSGDKSFLTRLFGLIPKSKEALMERFEGEGVLLYGVSVIIASLCARRPLLTEEQTQIEKLKKMARGNDKGVAASSEEDDAGVQNRVSQLVDAGALGILSRLVTITDSTAVRFNASRSYLSIVEEQKYRGKALQSGAVKALFAIIKQGLEHLDKKHNKDLDPSYLIAIQALAKLAITSSPIQVFGPDEGSCIDAIRPFTFLLLHPSSSLLQRFEAIMALTNLSSQGPKVASRVAASEGMMNKLELLMLEEHALMRRASTELICNLIGGSEEVYERYSGAGSKSKLQVLLALSDVEDVPTRLAASGALAMLTNLPDVCAAIVDLQRERHRAFPILALLLDPAAEEDEGEPSSYHPGLAHRGVVCVANIAQHSDGSPALEVVRSEAKTSGLLSTMMKVAANSEQAGFGAQILVPLQKSLKLLM